MIPVAGSIQASMSGILLLVGRVLLASGSGDEGSSSSISTSESDSPKSGLALDVDRDKVLVDAIGGGGGGEGVDRNEVCFAEELPPHPLARDVVGCDSCLRVYCWSELGGRCSKDVGCSGGSSGEAKSISDVLGYL